AQPGAAPEARPARRGAHLLPPPPGPAGPRLPAPAGRRGVAHSRRPAGERAGRRVRRMTRLAGKVAIVTGTSPNIGGGIAQGLADEGARLVCVDVAADNARQCAEWIV